ncbi:hypothetical protein BSKO_08076 [Bryopsis sp. KO-2023]|nr:hypothetical protein BSKO_08076 [Bryopsis sp. KO-2023]
MSNVWRGLGLLVAAYFCTLSTGLAFPEGYGSLHPVGGRVLLQQVDQPGPSEEANGTPLIAAAKGGRVETVRDLLLSSKVDPDGGDSAGRTALWHATLNGNLPTVIALLEGGADPNIASVNETSPLFLAAQSGSLAAVRKLVDFNAEIDHPSEKGATALLVAAQSGHKEIVRFLIDRGADVSVRKSLSRQSGLWSAAFYGYDEIVELMASKGADIEAAELGGATPLYAASQEGRLMAGLVLIDVGANVDAESDSGVTPLHVAAGACHLEMVAILLLFGADVNVRDAIDRGPEDVVCLERYQPKRQARVEELLEFSSALDEVISLADVLRLGVVFDPEVFAKILEMLGLDFEEPLGDVDLAEVPLVTASAEPKPLTQGVAIVGPRLAEGRVKASSSSKTFLYILIPLLVLLGLAVVISGYILHPAKGREKRNRKSRKRAPRGQMFIHNPLAGRQSIVSDSGRLRSREAPEWMTPQIPRPTPARGGSLDRMPSPLPKSSLFSDDTLLEQLREPQWFPPSRNCEREGCQPEVAKSEGSNSSGGRGVTIVHLTEEELSLRGPITSGEIQPNTSSNASPSPGPSETVVQFIPQVDPVLEHSPSPEPLPTQRPRNLWKLDMGSLNFFKTRKSSTATDLSGEISEMTEGTAQGERPQTSTSNAETFNTSYLGSQGGSSVHYSPRDSREEARYGP